MAYNVTFAPFSIYNLFFLVNTSGLDMNWDQNWVFHVKSTALLWDSRHGSAGVLDFRSVYCFTHSEVSSWRNFWFISWSNWRKSKEQVHFNSFKIILLAPWMTILLFYILLGTDFILLLSCLSKVTEEKKSFQFLNTCTWMLISFKKSY